jgi:hypothetical protein
MDGGCVINECFVTIRLGRMHELRWVLKRGCDERNRFSDSFGDEFGGGKLEVVIRDSLMGRVVRRGWIV